MALDCRTVECYGMSIIRSQRDLVNKGFDAVKTEYVGMF